MNARILTGILAALAPTTFAPAASADPGAVAPAIDGAKPTGTSLAAEKTAEDNKTSTEDSLVKPVGFLGVGDSRTPQWALIADTALGALDVDDPSSALGIEYSTAFRLSRFMLRKNITGSTIEATRGDRALGRSLLIPSLANFSLSARLEFRPYVTVRCAENCKSDVAEERRVVLQTSKGAYVSAEIGATKITAIQSDGAAISDYAVPIAVSAGLMYRVDGEAKLGTLLNLNRVTLLGYVGPTVRLVGAEMTDRERIQILSTKAASFWGAEAGFGCFTGNVMFDFRLTYLDNYRTHRDGPDPHVPGLTGFQAQISISFVLPTEIASTAPPPS